MSWSPFWGLVESGDIAGLSRGLSHYTEDFIEQDPRLEPHLIGAMAYWLRQYDDSAPPIPTSGGRLLWQDGVDEQMDHKYTQMAAHMGASAAEYSELVRPTEDMLYRMGGHPRTDPAATAVDALAKFAAAGITDTASLVEELALVLEWATPRRQVIGTHGLVTLKLGADISLGRFVDRFRAMLVEDPVRRHVHSRNSVSIGETTATGRKLHAVEALALIEATEAVSIVDRARDVPHLVEQQDWAGLAAYAIATVAAPEIVPGPPFRDELLPVWEYRPHGVWTAVRDAILDHVDTGGREVRIAAVVLFTLLSGEDPGDIDLCQVAAESTDIASLLDQVPTL